MVRVVRCLLSHCSRTQYRSKVKEALRSSSWKFKLDTLKEIDFTSIDDYGKNGSKEDVYKIFAFQLGQVLSLIKGVEVYTKSSIAKEHIGLKKYLYREKDTPLDSILELLNVFIETAKSYEHVEKDGLTTFIKFDKTIDLNKEEYI
ncbi:hypothetical protein D3C81_1728720 [compost metagenome]